MVEWKVERGMPRCAGTEREFEPGERYYSALVEEGDSFRRLDFCAEAWPRQNAGEFFSFWKTRLPAETDEPKRRFIDTNVIYSFFTRLQEAEGVGKLTFRYLLALILIRKRYLRLDSIVKQDDGEHLAIWDRRAQESLQVVNPDASREQLATAQQDLSCIFDMDFDEAALASDAPGPDGEVEGELDADEFEEEDFDEEDDEDEDD